MPQVPQLSQLVRHQKAILIKYNGLNIPAADEKTVFCVFLRPTYLMALRRLCLTNLLDLGRFYLIIEIKQFVFYPINNGVKY